jgi:hypothetical protein
MGAETCRQVCSDAVYHAVRRPLTCADMGKQATCTLVCSVRDEEAAGSNPATPTQHTGHLRSWRVASFMARVTN